MKHVLGVIAAIILTFALLFGRRGRQGRDPGRDPPPVFPDRHLGIPRTPENLPRVDGSLIMMKYVLAAMLFAIPAAAFWGSQTQSSDKATARTSEQAIQQIDQMVGFPSIVNGFEKRMVRMLYELRDNPEFKTITYITTYEGRLIKICDSIGFGINASIQFSNPQKVYQESGMSGRAATFIPQAEPNGLFMPEGLSATYVMCMFGDEMKPVYLEPEIIVSPVALQ